MAEKIVEFKCIYGTASLSGYAYVDELDDDDHGIHFIDENGFETNQIPYSHEYQGDGQKLYEAFTTDVLFIQFLADFQDENVTIDREDYTLIINEGTQLEMEVLKVDEYDEKGVYYNAKISFQFGDTILDGDWLDELGDLVATTWNEETYKMDYGENAIFLRIDVDWWDEEYYKEQKESVEEEMLSDAETLFVRQLIMDKGVYTKYQDLLEKHYLETDDKRIFDKSSIRDIANNYEQILESENIEDLNNICEEELTERIIDDIKGDE